MSIKILTKYKKKYRINKATIKNYKNSILRSTFDLTKVLFSKNIYDIYNEIHQGQHQDKLNQ